MKILIVGDSHVDTTDAYLNSKTACFGDVLAKKLSALGHNVTVAGVGGSTVADWLGEEVSRKGKSIRPSELPQSPDLLMVVLGSNDMGKGGDAASAVADFPKLVERFNPSKSLWIGPPRMRSTSKYNNENMGKLYDAATAAGLPIFDSRPATTPDVDAGDGDGIHSGPKSAEAWASAVAAAVGGGSSAPTGSAGSSFAKPALIIGGIALVGVLLAFALRGKK